MSINGQSQYEVVILMISHLGWVADLVPEVVVEGVTVTRSASTDPATLQNVVRGEC